MERKTMTNEKINQTLTPEIQERAVLIQAEIHEIIELIFNVHKEARWKWWYRFYNPITYDAAWAVALNVKLAQLELKLEELNIVKICTAP